MTGELEQLNNVASTAVLRLRERRLKAGQPFMINLDNLPKSQCYLEYPDHTIQLVSFDNSKNFIPIRTLSVKQGKNLRHEFGIR